MIMSSLKDDYTFIFHFSGLENSAHVYRDKTRVYASVLSRVDISMDLNAHYKLQLLESDSNDKYVDYTCGVTASFVGVKLIHG